MYCQVDVISIETPLSTVIIAAPLPRRFSFKNPQPSLYLWNYNTKPLQCNINHLPPPPPLPFYFFNIINKPFINWFNPFLRFNLEIRRVITMAVKKSIMKRIKALERKGERKKKRVKPFFVKRFSQLERKWTWLISSIYATIDPHYITIILPLHNIQFYDVIFSTWEDSINFL